MTLVISKGLTLDNGTRAAAIAGVSPTLDYRFAREKREIETVSLTDKLTFTGGNQGTFVGSDGFIQRATTNVPKFDHDPLSRRSLGLLSEVERTNRIRNNTMVGAVAGTPGTLPTNWPFQSAGGAGLAVTIVGTGIEAGIRYLDWKVSGTATSNTSATISFGRGNALTGQTWTTSSYVKLAAGTLTGVTRTYLSLIEETSGGAFVAGEFFTIGPPTNASLITQRGSGTRTFSGGATVALVRTNLSVDVSNGSTVDLTLRTGLPQLEQGAFATSVIPTTTATVTRTADSAVIDGTGVITGTYTMVEKPAGCAVVSGSNINLQPGFTAERVMVFPAALDAGRITAIRGAM
jgi:hypothetical protein